MQALLFLVVITLYGLALAAAYYTLKDFNELIARKDWLLLSIGLVSIVVVVFVEIKYHFIQAFLTGVFSETEDCTSDARGGC